MGGKKGRPLAAAALLREFVANYALTSILFTESR